MHISCDIVPYAINAAVYTLGKPPTVPRSVARPQARLALTSRPSSLTPPLLSFIQVWLSSSGSSGKSFLAGCLLV